MNQEVLRIGGIVRPVSDHDEQLSRMAEDLGEDEFTEWMREYEAGEWVLVCVEMFADVRRDHEVTRFCDGRVRPLTFGVPHDDDNVEQARDAVAQYVDALAVALKDIHVDVAAEALQDLPIHIELDPDIESQLSA